MPATTRAECEADCLAKREGDLAAELTRHNLAIVACNGSLQCEADEGALHDANVQAIVDGYEICMTSCKTQFPGN